MVHPPISHPPNFSSHERNKPSSIEWIVLRTGFATLHNYNLRQKKRHPPHEYAMRCLQWRKGEVPKIRPSPPQAPQRPVRLQGHFLACALPARLILKAWNLNMTPARGIPNATTKNMFKKCYQMGEMCGTCSKWHLDFMKDNHLHFMPKS